MSVRRLQAGAAIALLLVGGCAPEAEPVGGAVGDAVRRALESGRDEFDSSDWGALLAGGTRQGLVDYGWFRRHRDGLEAYLDRVARQEMAVLSPADLEALLINAYNALTIRSILEHPGVDSIRDIPGVWTETTHRVAGHDLTLDGIEHGILRPFYRDPRIHFAVNCASMSCAPLPPWPYEAGKLDAQLEERKATFLADPDNVRVEAGTLLLSRYFDWYGSDFTQEGWKGAADSIVEYVRRDAPPEVAEFIEGHDRAPPVEFMEYDWSLNAAPEE